MLSSLALVVGLTSLASLIGALSGLGLGLGEALAPTSATLLNLELPPWQASRATWAAGLGLGLLLPLLFTALSVWRRTGQPAALALSERELQRQGSTGPRIPLFGPLALRLALRNSLRRRRRFVLSSLLLAVAGAVFMGGLNLRAAWDHLLVRRQAQRRYQIELRPPAPTTRAALEPLLLRVAPEVRVAEAWTAQRATWVVSAGYAVSRAYPDGGHGQLLLRQVPPGQTLQRALAWVALGTGLVGVVALAGALGSGVTERKRELAVLHTLGASNRLLALKVMGEALLVVLVSVIGAVALGGLLDPMLAARLGEISGQALRPSANGLALPLWTLLALAGGLLASAGAARASARGGGQWAWPRPALTGGVC